MADDITALTPGTQLTRNEFSIDDEYARRYLAVVNPHYSAVRDWVPPHGIATRAVLSLLDSLSLPAGTVHVSQSVTSHAQANLGSIYSMLTTVTQTRVVRGYLHIGLSFNVYDNKCDAETLILQGDTVVMVPLETDQEL